MTSLSLEFENTIEDGHATLSAATGFLETEGAYNPDIELALAEAINNVVEHAYPGIGQAKIELSTSQTSVKCVLTDAGVAYLPSQSGSASNSNGFGWHLIRSLTDHCRLDRVKGTNKLSLEFVVNNKYA